MKNIINMYFATHKTCNLRCRYCYVPEYNKNTEKIIDDDILSALKDFIYKAESENYRIGSFCLHGAEPSLMKAETMAECQQLIAAHRTGQGIGNYQIAVQSNGVNFTPEYLKKLEDITGKIDAVKLGFSIDPPKENHDYYRNNSYDKVFSNYLYALEKGFPVSVLSVVSRKTMKYLNEFKIWMKEQLRRKEKYGNPYKVKLKLATGAEALNESEIERFADFLIENDLTKLMQILSPGYCLQSGNECEWFEFGIDGAVYSCNKSYFDEGIFANWKEQSFDEIFQKRRILFEDYPVHEDCSKCMYEFLCNSGCPIDRYKKGIMKGKGSTNVR